MKKPYDQMNINELQAELHIMGKTDIARNVSAILTSKTIMFASNAVSDFKEGMGIYTKRIEDKVDEIIKASNVASSRAWWLNFFLVCLTAAIAFSALVQANLIKF